MKKLTYAIVALCSTVLVCTRKDTGEADLWVRSIEPRLSTAREWRPCRKLNGSPRQVVATAQCGNAQPRAESIRQKACDVLIRNREEALHVLVSQPQCIDTVIPRLETFSPPDLAAAYYYRAQVMDRASDLLRALQAAQNAVNMNDNLPVSLFNQALAQEALGLRADAVESWTRFLELERQSEWADEARARRGALLAAPVMRRSRSARASVVATEPLEGANALRKLEAALTAAKTETDSQGRLSALHRLEAAARAQGYGALVARVQATLAFYLSTDNRPEEALEAYDNALATYTAIGDEAGRVKVYVRRTGLLRLLGGNELSWRDALRAIRLAPHAVDSNDQHLAYGEPAATAAALGYPEIALKYQTAAVQMFERDLLTAKGAAVAAVKHDLGIALRERAAISLQLAQYESARKDLDRAIAMTDAVSEQNRLILQARIHEVQGQASLPVYPNRAVRAFTDALALAAETDDFRSVRANLFVQRADAHARAGRTAQAQADLRQALAALRPEQSAVLQTRVRGKRESLWHPYFSRFEETYQRLIRLSIEQGDYELALAYAEESRSIDPLDLLSLSGPLPPQIKALGRTAETMDIRAMRAQLPPNTFVIEYALFDDRTYAWVMSRDRLEVVTLRARRRDVERWARELQHAAFTGDALTFEDRLQAPYYELVAEPLAAVERLGGRNRNRALVFVPDGAMHGLPFAALKNPDPAGGRYVIEDASVALSGSTILYLYSLARSRELASIAAPSILLVGDPAFDRDSAVTEGLKRLEFAYREVAKIAPLYGESEPLLRGDAATAGQFFQLARSRNVIHVAAHAITNEDDPSSSMILFAKTQQHRGLVTAAELMKNLDLTQTRLVVLSTCSSTGGFPVGKNGVAPLVRPLLAERVPAVIGTLWDIDDATAAELMVSFHRHYRKSNDVTEALAQAQRDLLKNYPAYTWAPFQVIGH